MHENLMRLPPHDPKAEMTVLGCLLNGGRDSLDEAIGCGMTEDWFYEPKARLLWSACSRIESQYPVDMLTAHRALGVDAARVPLQYLTACVEAAPAPAAMSYWRDSLEASWLRRLIIRRAADIMARAYDATGEYPAQLLDALQDGILELRGNGARDRILAMPAVMRSASEYISALANPEVNNRVKTGIYSLDALISLDPGDVCIIAARPSVGKTAMATTIAVNSLSVCKGVGILSLEMQSQMIGLRLLAAKARVSMADLRKDRIMPADLARLTTARAELYSARCVITEAGGMDIAEVKSILRRMKRRQGIDIGIVDYLQLVGDRAHRDSREQEVSGVSRGLKQIAMELRIPLIVCAQLNRSGDHGAEPREPRKSDLRESGAIEQDADQVILLHPGERCGDVRGVKAIIDKNRNGETGNVNLDFHLPFTLFTAEAVPQVR